MWLLRNVIIAFRSRRNTDVWTNRISWMWIYDKIKLWTEKYRIKHWSIIFVYFCSGDGGGGGGGDNTNLSFIHNNLSGRWPILFPTRGLFPDTRTRNHSLCTFFITHFINQTISLCSQSMNTSALATETRETPGASLRRLVLAHGHCYGPSRAAPESARRSGNAPSDPVRQRRLRCPIRPLPVSPRSRNL